ncbi:MAG TPA: glycosyltransferase family 4 protein [Bacteroidales bacterium]
MKLGYVTIYDAQNIRNYSGTGYYLAKSLEDVGIEVFYIGGLKLYSRCIYRAKERLYKRIFNRIYIPERNPRVLKHYAKQISERLKIEKADVLLSPSSIPLTLMDTKIPMVIYPDAIFSGMIDFYSNFTNLSKETIKDGHWQEQEMLNRASLAVFSSEWAANTVKSSYTIDESKIKVLPYGANIESTRNEEDIERLLNKKKSSVCKLLFIGVDWKRKGGKIALGVTNLLNNEMGIPTELIIAGCIPPDSDKLPHYVKTYGFIDKSSQSGKNLINRLNEESHFLILPSEADCTPIVFAEANSFGIPCITKDVGGISSLITNGMNGIALNAKAGIEEYAKFIKDSFQNYENYRALAITSFREYQNRLNWSVTGNKLKEMLAGLVK